MGGKRGCTKSTMGIGNVNLRRSPVRNTRRSRLNACFSFFLSLHHPTNRLDNIYIFYLCPKKSLRQANIGGEFAPTPFTPSKYAYDSQNKCHQITLTDWSS